jgi:hypothetical protein
VSKVSILDDRGKDLDTSNDAHEHGRKLIDKILLHVGYDDAEEWKVIVSNDESTLAAAPAAAIVSRSCSCPLSARHAITPGQSTALVCHAF